MACHGTFLSCHEKNDPDPNSSRDLDPDKPVLSTSCQEDVTDPAILCAFFVFTPYCTTFASNPSVVESVSGSVPVEHPH